MRQVGQLPVRNTNCFSDTNFWTILWCRVGQSLVKLILSLSLNKLEMFLPGNANFQLGLCLPSTSFGIVPTKLHPNRGFPQLCNNVYCSGVRLHCLIVYKVKFTLAPVIYRPNDWFVLQIPDTWLDGLLVDWLSQNSCRNLRRQHRRCES